VSGAADLVPAAFADQVASYPPDRTDARPAGPGYAVSGAEWVRGLPRLLAELLDEWSLTPDGPSRWGRCAVVVPVRSESGPAALKVGWPHHEAVTEHLALRHWDGRGAVRLLRADPRRFALLLERLDPVDLTTLPDDEACAVVGDLLSALRAPAIARTPTLSAEVARRLAVPPPLDVLPRRFVDQARRLATELVADPGVDGSLLHTDLHQENVLRGTRRPWLAVDPKPLAGDRAYEVAPVLWNRAAELGTGSALRWSVRHRLEVVCEHAGIDEDRAKAWSIVRVVDLAADEPPGSALASLAVAVVKALND
jgi:streptomycin 6-kinase